MKQHCLVGVSIKNSMLVIFTMVIIVIALSCRFENDSVARLGEHESKDHRALVSASDLIYQSPKTAHEGHPIGNGRMGTMVWTSSSAINFQINRNDVFAVNKEHIGLQKDYSMDYCGACAKVTINTGGSPFDGSGTFEQLLSLYDAEETITGDDVTVRCFVSSVSDVIAVEVDDRRPSPQPLEIIVSMWRDPNVVTQKKDSLSTSYHQARYDFNDSMPKKIVIAQYFNEHFNPQYQKAADFHCRSAVAAQIEGTIAEIQSPNSRIRKIIAPAQSGKRMILISSAASFSNQDDVAATALSILNTASRNTYDTLRQNHINWWHDFWSRTFVDLSSDDGSAEFMEKIRHLHLYHMASSSRGSLPPKWNASIFSVSGDTRTWGAPYWVWTEESLYWPLLASDAIDLTESFFNMYVNQLSDAYLAGPQRWGITEGAYFPETAAFDGPVILPETAGAEFRDVLYGRKTKDQLSNLTKILCQYCSQLRLVTTRHPYQELIGEDRFGWITHMASSGSEIAIHAWWRYRYTGDAQWLASHAYPLLKGTVQFYKNLAQIGDDGLFHIIATMAHEDFWGVDDSIYDIAAIRSTVPLAIKASKILDVDADLRGGWQTFLDNLAPYTMGSDPRSQALPEGVLANDVWSGGHYNFVEGSHNSEDVWVAPIFPFEDWTLETNDPSMDHIAQKVIDLAPRMQSILGGTNSNTAIRSPIAWARAGRGSALPSILSSYYHAFDPMENGMSMFEGSDAQSVEHLGILTCTLQEALLQSVSPHPGEPEIMSVFPAWPNQWDASFCLLARGGFLVTSAIDNGQVKFVKIKSRLGGTCRLRNPWGISCNVTEVGGSVQHISGEILTFATSPKKSYKVFPETSP